MGITFSLMEKLRARNVLAGTRIRVLDIGSSNLYQADAAGIIAFVKSFPQANTGPDLPAFAERLAKGSGYGVAPGDCTVTTDNAPFMRNTASTLPTRSTTAIVALTLRACASATARAMMPSTSLRVN